jgi:excisionase family DNA binding protein
MKDDSAERFLSVKDVVARTGVSERTIRALISRGQLPSVRPAGLRVVRIPERFVTALMSAKAI